MEKHLLQGWLYWLWSWTFGWFSGPTVSLYDCLSGFFGSDELKGDNMYRLVQNLRILYIDIQNKTNLAKMVERKRKIGIIKNYHSIAKFSLFTKSYI